MSSDPGKDSKLAPPDVAAVDEHFLRRWSRRKHEALTEPAPAPVATDAAPMETPPVERPVLTDADMPPIESLGEDSDYSPFMSSGVSETLRRQALRKLFTLPSVNQREILNSEYYDCHGFEPLGNIVTHEMKEEIERQAQKLAREIESELRRSVMEEESMGRATVAASIEQKSPLAEPAAPSASSSPEGEEKTHPFSTNRKLTKRRRT